MEYSFFIFSPLTMLLGWLMTFIISGHFHQLHDRILIALLVCSCFPIYITARKLVDGYIDYTFILLENIETIFALVVCPLSFLYIRTVAREVRWHKWYYCLFAPGVIIWQTGTILSVVIGWDKILEIRQAHHTIFVPEPGNIVENLYKLIYIDIFDLTLEIMSAILIGWSIYYLIFYHKHACNYYANIEDSSVGKMHYFLLFSILIFTTVFFVTFFIHDLVGASHLILLSISLWLSILIYGLAFNAYKIMLTHKHIKSLEMAKDLVGTNSVRSNRMPIADTTIYRAENCTLTEDQGLKEISDNTLGLKIYTWEKGENKPFLKEGLTLADVADQLKITPRELSNYINKKKGINFNLWINTLRIEEAKHILKASPVMKIGYISVICGFTDLSAFDKTFHNIVKCSPQTFRNSKKYDK